MTVPSRLVLTLSRSTVANVSLQKDLRLLGAVPHLQDVVNAAIIVLFLAAAIRYWMQPSEYANDKSPISQPLFPFGPLSHFSRQALYWTGNNHQES